MDKKNKKKNHYNATTSTWGMLSLDYYFTDPKSQKLPEKEKLKIISRVVDRLSSYMLDDGIVQFFSANDLAKKYGTSRQYWDKMFSEGKIPYKMTSAGKITTDLWVKGYMEEGDSYGDFVLKGRQEIIKEYESNHRSSGLINCPRCEGKEKFSYNYNQGSHINGSCSACGFRINTLK